MATPRPDRRETLGRPSGGDVGRLVNSCVLDLLPARELVLLGGALPLALLLRVLLFGGAGLEGEAAAAPEVGIGLGGRSRRPRGARQVRGVHVRERREEGAEGGALARRRARSRLVQNVVEDRAAGRAPTCRGLAGVRGRPRSRPRPRRAACLSGEGEPDSVVARVVREQRRTADASRREVADLGGKKGTST